MRPYFDSDYGNPSSIHTPGVVAWRAVETARAGVAAFLAANPVEVIFTSGGTEANNLAILGLRRGVGHMHIITTTIEHASVLEPCRALECEGWRITYLPVNAEGLINPKDLAQTISGDTTLVSIGYANNEVGTIQPLREVARFIRRFRKEHDTQFPLFHTDACQAPRFLELNVHELGVDLLSLNGGKAYGPKGSGALYIRKGLTLEPIIYGGGQESGRRSGTANVPAIVGLAQSLKLCAQLREKERESLSRLRDYFIKQLLTLPDTSLNGSPTERLPHNANVSFLGTDSEFVVLNLDAHGVTCSSGSACSAHSKDASYVVRSLASKNEQEGERRARSAVRFTLGRDTTRRDIDRVLRVLPPILARAKTSM